MTTTTARYHVYAEDGYESAHRTEGAAIRAAKRGAKARRIEYRVVECDAHGLTGGGHGYLRATINRAGNLAEPANAPA